MMLNLLAPRSPEWRINVIRNDEEYWFEYELVDDIGTFFRYRVHIPEGLSVEDVVEGIRMGLKYEFIPPIFFTSPYIHKIRTELGWKPNPFDFMRIAGRSPTPPPLGAA